ncbi:hypothetical protein NC652_015161 [Populus alba x Populus x berolinensis]|nr:hypothetical protein NC652_015161 [Populus alba x Populus x berolinensis]
MAVAESSRETTAGTLRNAFGNVLSFFILLLIGVLAFSIRKSAALSQESLLTPSSSTQIKRKLKGVFSFY